MSELTRVHIAFLKLETVENYFKRVRGEARVSSGGAAGSVRPYLETLLVFLLFLFVSNKVCVVRSRVRECLPSSYVALRELPVVLACAVVPDIFLELLVLLLLLLVVSLVPQSTTDRDLDSVFVKRKVNAWICEQSTSDRDLETKK